jgi:hypothetical protein
MYKRCKNIAPTRKIMWPGFEVKSATEKGSEPLNGWWISPTKTE